MSYRSSLSFIIIDQYLTDRVMALELSRISEVKFAAGGILVSFRGRHLVLTSFILVRLSSLSNNILSILLLVNDVAGKQHLLFF
jgi:hypothetical protein